jgi:hypothetical protein
LVSLKRSNLVSTSFIFVPDHAEVRGNERADRLAGTAIISDGRAMDHADVLHSSCEAGRVEESLGDCDSSTMERLRVGQVKLDTSRHEHYADS